MNDSCNPMDCSLPGSSVYGILQARILEWVAISLPGDLPNPGIKPTSLMPPALAGEFFTTSTTWVKATSFLFFGGTQRLADLSSLARDWTRASAIEVQSPNHWTARGVGWPHLSRHHRWPGPEALAQCGDRLGLWLLISIGNRGQSSGRGHS